MKTRTVADLSGLPLHGAGSGSLRVILRHQVGTKDGTETPGSTDFDTTFPVTIQ